MFFFTTVHRVTKESRHDTFSWEEFPELWVNKKYRSPQKNFKLKLWDISSHRELECRDFLMVHFFELIDIAMEMGNFVQICCSSRDSGSIGAPLVCQDPWVRPITLMAELRDSSGTIGTPSRLRSFWSCFFHEHQSSRPPATRNVTSS